MPKNPIDNMFKYLLLLLAGWSSATLLAQNSTTAAAPNGYDLHPQFRENSLTTRRFNLSNIEPLILALNPPFERTLLGKSVEGRNIYQLRWGQGPIKVLLWSQMHGDESTATMALLDLFRFLAATDGHDSWRQQLRERLSVYCIPMLNPDGAQRYLRRNAQGIDINRDALRLQTPEGQILKRAVETIRPDWGFNLHDQGRYTGVGLSPNPAAIAFLAPAYDEGNNLNETRSDAMRLIGLLNQAIQPYLPGLVSRYNDAFEPRAFGDNIQKWGTRTILIESGGLRNDLEKQTLRRVNFLAFLTALESIATGSFRQLSLDVYENLLVNEPGVFHEIILRGLELPKKDGWYLADLAFRQQEITLPNGREVALERSISELGDLSTYHGYEEVDLSGYQAKAGLVYPTVLPDLAAVLQLNLHQLRNEGYTDFQVKNWQRLPPGKYPFQLIRPVPTGQRRPPTEIRIGQNPTLLLRKNGQIDYVVANGFLVRLD